MKIWGDSQEYKEEIEGENPSSLAREKETKTEKADKILKNNERSRESRNCYSKQKL